jgi:hypothetical protein
MPHVVMSRGPRLMDRTTRPVTPQMPLPADVEALGSARSSRVYSPTRFGKQDQAGWRP